MDEEDLIEFDTEPVQEMIFRRSVEADEEDLIQFDTEPVKEMIFRRSEEVDEEDLIQFDTEPVKEMIVQRSEEMDEEDLIEFDTELVEEMKQLRLREGCVYKHGSVQKDGANSLPSAENSSPEHHAINPTPLLNNTQSDVKTTHTATSPTGVQVVLPKKAVEKKEIAPARQYKRDPTICAFGFHNHYLWETIYAAGHRCDVCKRMQTEYIYKCPKCPFKICWACRCDYGLTNKTAKELRRRRKRV